MGFLKVGTPLSWRDSLPHLAYVRKHGLIQFLHIFNALKDRKKDELKWGDEVEYHLVQMENESKEKATGLALIGHDMLDALAAKDKETGRGGDSWKPEYGCWMLEGTPGTPYGDDIEKMGLVEADMLERRKYIDDVLPKDVHLFSTVAYPRTGCKGAMRPVTEPGGDAAASAYLPDSVINHHPRFSTLTRNIRHRRGTKVHIRVPIFRDTDTVVHERKVDDDFDEGAFSDDTDGFVHMDAMGFGMGCCCLQVTFQARHLEESRRLYDQLAILSPLMMALTAASPVFKGHLTDHDARWEVIRAMTDCRTPQERGIDKELEWQTDEHACNASGHGKRRLLKPRYDSISCFLSTAAIMKEEYNDVDLPVDEDAKAFLMENGVDERLATHLGHLWVRDPLVIFKESVELDDEKTTEHFENLQSTNWQNVRWKPPPPGAPFGWRVELRTMEAQFTDFENAAFAVFTALINRVILFFDLNMYMPLSKVDENMKTAHMRNAAVDQKFYFRKFVEPLPETCPEDYGDEDPDSIELMTLSEILMGKGSHFPGLIPLILTYLDIIGASSEAKTTISHYLRFVELRASGDLMTPATWMRKFIREHPDYKNDSVVSDTITYDLLAEIDAIAHAKKACPEMFGATFGPQRPTPGSPVDSKSAAKKSARRRMRGGSFASEATASECIIIHQLVERYSTTTSFNDTPAYLAYQLADDDADLAVLLGEPEAAADAGAGTGGAGAGAGAGSE